tara:strand:+ start:6105 stop:9767 length:3663 start_codon:yes stop_codon:yes gene_type:complete
MAIGLTPRRGFVIKAYKTKTDAENDDNALYHINDSRDCRIGNGAQPAGFNFFTHEEYFFRIEAAEPVKEIYIDWDDGDDNDPDNNANYTRVIFETGKSVAIVSHIFTRDPIFPRTSTVEDSTGAIGHFPKIRIKSTSGFLSKYYMPSGGRFDGIDEFQSDANNLLTAGPQSRFLIEADQEAANKCRIPIFLPTPKPPVAILKADRKRVYAGINNNLLIGSPFSATITDCDMDSGVGTVTIADGALGKHVLTSGNPIILDLSNNSYDEATTIKDVTEGNKFTYVTTLGNGSGGAIADQANMTGTVHFSTHRGAILKLISNPTVQSARTAVQVEVTYISSGKINTTGGADGFQGKRGDIAVDILSFGGTTTTSDGVLKVLKVELLDLTEATATDDTTKLGAGERLALAIQDFNGENVNQTYKTVAEVSLGNPIVEIDDRRYTVTYDATESFSRIPEHSITDYYIDTGHDHWISYGDENDDLQTASSTQVSDTLSDFKGDTLKATSGVISASYSFIPAMEYLDEDNRWIPKQVLARAQIQTTTPNVQTHDSTATYTKSYLTHWRDESSSIKPTTGGADYSASREDIQGYSWPSDMISSNLLAVKSNRDPDDWTNLGTDGVNESLWKGSGFVDGAILHYNGVNTSRRVGGPIGNFSGGTGGTTTLDDDDNITKLMTCSRDKFTELFFKVSHGKDTQTTSHTASDGGTSDARYYFHSTPVPSLSNVSSQYKILTDSGRNGTRQNLIALKRITGVYTASLSDTDYERTISDVDYADTSNEGPVIGTVTTSTAHGLSVGDEVFINVQHTVSGTASGGSTTTLADVGGGLIDLGTDNYWKHSILTITSGTNSGTSHYVTGSEDATDSGSGDGDTLVTFDAISAAMDNTSVYTLEKDLSECVLVKTVPTSTTFTYSCTRMAVAPVNNITNLTGKVQGIAQWKPLKVIDNTRYEKHSNELKDLSFTTSGTIKWEEPEDWIKIDPARIPDRYWPLGKFEPNFTDLQTDSDDEIFSSHDDKDEQFFDFEGRWDHKYPKFGILWNLDTTTFVGGSSSSENTDRYRDTQIQHCYISSEPHCVTVEVIDPMHVSLNDRAIAQSVSYSHRGKFQVVEDRMGLADVRKIGNAGGTITFGGIDLIDTDSTHTRDKFHQYQRRATPVYMDITHESGVVSRFYGVITQMSEDHPSGGQYGKFGLTMQCSHMIQIDSSGHKLEDGFIALGGDPIDERKFIR